MSDVSDKIAKVLIANGISPEVVVDTGIHSWRCAYPGEYGKCTCFAELVADMEKTLIPVGSSLDVQYGVILDDMGSTDTYDTEAEAREAANGECPVVRITTITTPLTTPSRKD